MIVCLSCRHAAPDASAYCPFCARSLNVVVCPSGHKSALGSLCCSTCGNLQLSDGTRALPLGWLSTGLSVVIGVLAWKAILPCLVPLLHVLMWGALWSAAVLTNSSVPQVHGAITATLCRFIDWTLTLWLLGQLLTLFPGGGGRFGASLRSIPSLIVRFVWGVLRPLPRLALRLAGRLLFGTPGRARPTRPKASGNNAGAGTGTP